MDKLIKLTQEEINMVYAACMSYGGRLSETIESIPYEEAIQDVLSKKAEKHWELARKMTAYMEG